MSQCVLMKTTASPRGSHPALALQDRTPAPSPGAAWDSHLGVKTQKFGFLTTLQCSGLEVAPPGPSSPPPPAARAEGRRQFPHQHRKPQRAAVPKTSWGRTSPPHRHPRLGLSPKCPSKDKGPKAVLLPPAPPAPLRCCGRAETAKRSEPEGLRAARKCVGGVWGGGGNDRGCVRTNNSEVTKQRGGE